MKICYLSNARSIHTVRWANHFAALGHEVSVVSFAAGSIPGIGVVRLSTSIAPSRSTVVRCLSEARRVIRQLKPDLVHAHYATSYGLAGVVAGWHPLVITMWGDDVLVQPEASIAYRQMVRTVLHRANLVHSLADHMTRLVVERRYCGPAKIVTIPFGVDTRLFRQTRRQGSGESVTIISTRHLSDEYDVGTFIRAMPLVLAGNPSVRFVVAGDGDRRDELERLASELNVADRTSFVGPLSPSEIAESLQRADVFVTTAVSDGNNVSLNEAMACGTLPVVSDIPANREWIVDGRNGLVFPLRDSAALARSILRAVADASFRLAARALNGQIIRERGCWRRNMEIMGQHYRRLACGHEENACVV